MLLKGYHSSAGQNAAIQHVASAINVSSCCLNLVQPVLSWNDSNLLLCPYTMVQTGFNLSLIVSCCIFFLSATDHLSTSVLIFQHAYRDLIFLLSEADAVVSSASCSKKENWWHMLVHACIKRASHTF